MISLPQIHDPPPADDCGPCNVCCDVVGVAALGKPFYARCPHLQPDNPAGGCGIHPTRPDECRAYRCAWHLGMLGPRVDRRPRECGILFEFERENGRWRLSAFETRPGALMSEKTSYLIKMITTNKKTRHLALLPEVHLIPYGADLPVLWNLSDIYRYNPPPPGMSFQPHGQMLLFSGKVRDLLMPRAGMPPSAPIPAIDPT